MICQAAAVLDILISHDLLACFLLYLISHSYVIYCHMFEVFVCFPSMNNFLYVALSAALMATASAYRPFGADFMCQQFPVRELIYIYLHYIKH